MADTVQSAFLELVARGRLAAAPEPQPLPVGNIDRRDPANRASWLASLPDGRKVRIVLGTDLTDLVRRHSAFAAAAPDLIAAPVFHEKLSPGEAFACIFFESEPLETVARTQTARAQSAFAQLCTALAATGKSSAESARLAEWQAWTSDIERHEFWTPDERRLLREIVWPRVYPLLTISPPVLRWTNGDFTGGNILIAPNGGVRLIDCEFASTTHFYREDAARFFTFSPAAREQPALFTAALPQAGAAWHLFFWLRQLALEFVQNTPGYFAHVAPVRLGVIRRLAEVLFMVSLEGWSIPAAVLHHGLETARWDDASVGAVRVTGWCHVAGHGLRQLVATQNDRWLESTPPLARPDVQAHFAGSAQALASGFDWVLSIPQRDNAVVLSAIMDDGTLLPFQTFVPVDLPGRRPWIADYARWAKRYDPVPERALPAAGPLFSVLLPVFNSPASLLLACLESVQQQQHSHWELQIVDDASTHPEVDAILRKFAANEPRARLHRRTTNGGIARATNDALAAATGEFIVLLDHDDLLRPHALAEFARALGENPQFDALYSDEDKITEVGARLTPFLKPDFSPEFLLGVMYIGHALCLRTAIARAAGGFDPTFDGIQDYEFFLRFTEQTQRIGHIPRILYHWRQSAASSALHGNVKGDMDARQAQAVQAHLMRRGRTDRVRTLGGHRLALECVSAPRYELVRTGSAADALTALQRASVNSTAEVLVLLAFEPIQATARWKEELAAAAALPDSGLCAPLLLSSEGWVLESGRVSTGQPIMRGFDPFGDGYNGSLPCRREVAAVAPLCLAIRRELMATPAEDWAGFCLRLRQAGLYLRVCPTARLQTSTSWQEEIPPASRPVEFDPFFNPHFDARRADYSLAVPPAHLAPVRWHLDTPLASALRDGCLILRGWAFATNGYPLQQIRLRAGALTIAGAFGVARPDVRATHPEAPNDYCGFEIRGILPAGAHDVTIETLARDGAWTVLVRQPIDVRTHRLPLWLGGGSWQQLMFFQMPAHAVHLPRKIHPESFPRPSAPGPRPRLAVVTPSFQQVRFLEETMRSVLEQAGVACDYVVQDGGSTDGSAPLIASQAARLRAYEIGPDGGQADAIVRGFAKTSGGPDDLMAWINSDDFYLPGALGFVADYFARHPEVDVIYGHRIVVDEKSQEIARWFLPKHDPGVLRLNDFIPQETLFWRRRAWERAGGIDPSFKFALDWDFLLRLQSSGAKIVRVPYFLGCFRIHSAQKTTAQIQSVGQTEITQLRERTFGRPFPPLELEANPILLRYLRRSSFIQFLWRLGLRAP